MSIGAKIREVRESKGVMQKFIEERMGQYSGWLSRIESGKQEVTARELFGMSELLSTPIYEFYLTVNIADSDNDANKSA